MYLPDFVTDITLLEFIFIPSLFRVIGRAMILLLVENVCGFLEIKLPDIISLVEPEPAGIPKFKIAFVGVPTLVTVASLPAGNVVVDPTATVAAVPGVPCSPLGITKFNTALLDVPEFVTLALVPGALAVVVPTFTVAASPAGPVGPGIGIKLLQQQFGR